MSFLNQQTQRSPSIWNVSAFYEKQVKMAYSINLKKKVFTIKTLPYRCFKMTLAWLIILTVSVLVWRLITTDNCNSIHSKTKNYSSHFISRLSVYIPRYNSYINLTRRRDHLRGEAELFGYIIWIFKIQMFSLCVCLYPLQYQNSYVKI